MPSFNAIDKARQIFEFAAVHGRGKAKSAYGLSAETFSRYMMAVKKEAGMQGQTSWMRGKRIAAHVGFCEIDAWVSPKGGISKFCPTFFPFYA